jgi:hypothetical protein
MERGPENWKADSTLWHYGLHLGTEPRLELAYQEHPTAALGPPSPLDERIHRLRPRDRPAAKMGCKTGRFQNPGYRI